VSKFAVTVLIVMLLSGTVLAIHDWQVYDTNIDSYAGQIARDRRIYDPYTRARYFGSDYDRQFNNFGQKGPTDRVKNTGFKSAYSSVFNLDTNAWSNRGRDPSYISNWDPEMRGFTRLDRAVALLPYSPVEQTVAGTDLGAKGTARILSTGNQYGGGMNSPYPQSQIQIILQNLPPVGDNEVYEAWLFDKETEYTLNIGIIKSGPELTGSLTFAIARLVWMFDSIIITKESFPDVNPNPGEIVLMGEINPAREDLTPPPSEFDRLR
jgi:hypothetical protein